MKEWFTASELADFGLPDLAKTERNIRATADRENWVSRPRQGQGGGFEYHCAALPVRAQAALLRKQRLAEKKAGPTREEFKVKLANENAWARFDALPEARKDKARAKLAVINDVHALVKAGTVKDCAIALVCGRADIPARTYWEWESKTHGLDRADWLPALVDHYAGRQAVAEMTTDAWDYFLADYLTQSEPAASASYARLMEIAVERDWIVPSLKTILRRIEKEIPKEVFVLKRKGPEALERLFPAQRRDRSELYALQAVNADGHKFDVFVKFPDGRVDRVVIFVFQDLYSGKILSWRIDRTENTQSFRLSFGDMIEKYGIPEKVLLDNTRVAANKKMSGGVPNRFRFKVKEDDPVGLMPQLGIEVIWATPYHGQAKPIERAFRDLCETIAKAPECAGAYTGNNPTAKPENYGSKAVPLDLFIAHVEREINRHNARPNRQTKVCGGTKSFDQVFEESYASAPIRKDIRPEVRRLWLLESDAVVARKPDGHLEYMGNRYWHHSLLQLIGTKLVLRFDPENVKQPVHVYRLDGSFVATADCIEDKGFFDQASAKNHLKAKGDFKKAARLLADAQVRLDAGDAVLMRPQIEAQAALDAKVVRPFFKDPTRARQVEAAPISEAEQARLDALAAEMAAPKPVITLETVDTRFRKVLNIEQRIAAGEYVTPDDKAWAERQSRQPDIRSKRDMYEEFGDAVLTA